MSIVGLDHLQVAAPPGCEAEARRFFGVLLGLSEVEKPEPLRSRGGVWFRLGTQQLHVGVAVPFTPARKAHPALTVAPGEIEALSDRMVAAGASVLWDDTLPGAQRFFSEDPWGNRIEFVAARTPANSYRSPTTSTRAHIYVVRGCIVFAWWPGPQRPDSPRIVNLRLLADGFSARVA